MATETLRRVRRRIDRPALEPAFLRRLPAEQRALYHRIPQQIEYVPSDRFEDDGVEGELFACGAPIEVPAWTHFPERPEEISRPPACLTLCQADERKLFLQYNYARFRLSELIAGQQKRKTTNRARAMVVWYERVVSARSSLVRANMALVLAMTKRTRIPNVEFSELVSEGNMALLRSVEKFDAERGYKFSTYACRAILKSFNRLASKTGRYRQHFPTEFDPALERSDHDVHLHEVRHVESVEALREILSANRARLTETERTIVMERFAIGNPDRRGLTLAEIGRIVGLTNERVRQIQNLALGKLRAAMSEEIPLH